MLLKNQSLEELKQTKIDSFLKNQNINKTVHFKTRTKKKRFKTLKSIKVRIKKKYLLRKLLVKVSKTRRSVFEKNYAKIL